jgi:ATP-dependent protease ClpP protease subunit
MENMNNKFKINKPTKSFYGYDEPKEYNVGFIPHKSGTYRIEIDTQIDEVSQFSTAIQVLNIAEKDDDVEIHLQCNGGNVDACGAFLHAMNKCEADIHIIASGGCHSAATHILLQADSFELADNFNSLIHNGSAGAYGNINEYHAKSDFDKDFLMTHYWNIYEGFLSRKEFEDMMDGKNIWIGAQEWCDRNTIRMEYFQNKWEEMQKEAQKASRPKRAKKTITKEQLQGIKESFDKSVDSIDET